MIPPLKWSTFESTVEYGEKGSRILDYSLLLLLANWKGRPPWLDAAQKVIHNSRDWIEFATCMKEWGLVYRGLSGIDTSEGSRLHGNLHPFRRGGDLLIFTSAIFTPLSLAHEWAGLPLGRYADLVEQIGKWTISLGHGVSLFGVDGLDKGDMLAEFIFFGMEAGFLDRCPLPLQALIAVGSGAWGVWRIPRTC